MDTTDKIILFCFLLQGVCSREFSVSLPEKIDALSGSCGIINCTFEIQDKYDNDLTDTATGGWHKDGTDFNNLVFNSSTLSQNSFIKGNITGKLKYKNCTTVFKELKSNHSGPYFFRIEGEGGLKWTYKEKHVSIQVIESPLKPRVQLYVNGTERQDQEEVLEGTSVSLRCSAETLCSSTPPTLTWSSTPRIPLSESSRLQELISDLNFTATHREHRVTFTCTITYQLQDKNKTAQGSITLHVQYAPKISNSSCSSRTDVTVCLCEADGNPSPELEWHLSGHPVTNSSNTFISEERLSSTGLRSSITLHQSLTHTSTLHCVSNNTRGNSSQLLQLHTSVERLNHFSVLIGVSVLALVVLLLYIITRVWKVHNTYEESRMMLNRKDSGKLPQTTQEDANRSGQNADEVTPQENQDNSVYVVMSPAGAAAANQDDIIYSTMDFTKFKSQKVGSISSLHAVVQDCSGGQSKEEQFEDLSQLYAKVTFSKSKRS